MLYHALRIHESLERTKGLDLEAIIRDLAGPDGQRQATRRQIEQRRATLLRQIDDPRVATNRLERILQRNDLTDINYLAQGLLRARSVCRIVIQCGGRQRGFGTGFLVAPGVLLTNHHVLSRPSEVPESVAQFCYERDAQGSDLAAVEFALSVTPEPIWFKDLDFALVAVGTESDKGEPLDQFGWLRLNPQPGKAFIGEYLTIIQHPNGERKQICVRENKLLKYSENSPYLWYQTDTVAGSSGSPVFNNSWDVVALHHSSVPKTKKDRNGQVVWMAKNGQPWSEDMGDDQVDWNANEGVRISRILEYLQSRHGSHPLARAVLSAGDSSPRELLAGNGKDIGEIRPRPDANGRAQILLSIDAGAKGVSHSGIGRRAENPPRVIPAIARVVEKVVIKDDYDQRNGYDPKFLGVKLVVPLPRVKSEKFGKVLRIKGTNSELTYWNYSIVMNKTRRLAYFSAANVDADKFQGNRDADGDIWYSDPRVTAVDPDAQIGKEFYKKQKEFEADRTANPFDQGHLTRRADLQWGDGAREARRNGNDSFHYTNCSPQALEIQPEQQGERSLVPA